jgi:hypothetical protein
MQTLSSSAVGNPTEFWGADSKCLLSETGVDQSFVTSVDSSGSEIATVASCLSLDFVLKLIEYRVWTITVRGCLYKRWTVYRMFLLLYFISNKFYDTV